jgi:hypothetical protein
MRALFGTLVLTLALPLVATAPALGVATSHDHRLSWQVRDTPSTESLRGLDAVDRRTAWVAGDGGGVWRTTDGGRSWADVAPRGAEGVLAFRDVEASSARTAVVLAIGEGEASRIYRTHDGGRTWRTSFVNDEPDAFYDCMDFFPDGRRGLALSDPVDGPDLARAPGPWDAGRGRGRVRVRGERDLPGDGGQARCLGRVGWCRLADLPLP